mgnify:CR=1 FL=1
MKDPLKQGLKHVRFNDEPYSIYKPKGVAEVVPLKQGLKPDELEAMKQAIFLVAEVVPLKQGLKLYNIKCIDTVFFVLQR